MERLDWCIIMVIFSRHLAADVRISKVGHLMLLVQSRIHDVRVLLWTGCGRGGSRMKRGWRNEWHVQSHYGQFSHETSDEMGVWEQGGSSREQPELLHLKSSMYRKWGRGDQVRLSPHWSCPQHTTCVSQWRVSSWLRRPARIFKDCLRNPGGYYSASCRAGGECAALLLQS